MLTKHLNMTKLCYKRFGIVLAVVALTTLPFLDKPIHIDDPFVLRIAENVMQNPLDPFAGTFDWFGKNEPIFETTTNPPLTSYYLAPFAAISGQSEIILHLSCILFYVLLAYALYILGSRFCQNPFLAALFVMSSSAVIVSGNVMRDVPAAALATLGIALFIHGTDDDKYKISMLGALLCGLSILTKYSCIVTLPVLLLYPLLKKKIKPCMYIFPALLVLGLWCIHNQWVYGAVHIVFLLQERGSIADITWYDNAWGAVITLSASLYLFPLIIWHSLLNMRWARLMIAALSCIVCIVLVQQYMNGEADAQFLFWLIGGTVFLTYTLIECWIALMKFINKPFHDDASDTLFLFAWMMAPFLFSILFVPFQAVRHLLLALPPLTLLSFRIMNVNPVFLWKPLTLTLFVVQLMIALGVQYADYEFADGYRRFAQEGHKQYVNEDDTVWFAGHWGWQYYMNRAGFAQVRYDEPLPEPGDLLFQPDVVPHEYFGLRKAFVDKVNIEAAVPIRTMNWSGAAFYALRTDGGAPNLPYRFFQETHLDSIRVYRIKEQETTN